MMLYAMIIMLCCNAAVYVSAQNEGRAEAMCRQISDLFMRQCSSMDAPTTTRHHSLRGFPGKKGDSGAIGPPGAAGPPGPRGIVDYQQVDRKIAAAKLELQTNFDEKLAQLKKQMLTVKDCELQYDGKCFTAIIHKGQDVNFAAAESLCNNIGWNLANLYSVDHYNRLTSYLRTKPTSDSFIGAWIGMTYSEKRIFLSDGTQITQELPWYPSYPNTPTYNKIYLIIRKDPESKYHGMRNSPISTVRHGALCEISANTLLVE